MSEFQKFGSQLRELLTGFLQAREAELLKGSSRFEKSALFDDGIESFAAQYTDLLEVRAMSARRDPTRVPGSRHFAATLAYGDFILTSGPTIRCEAILGISGVKTMKEIETLENGIPQVKLERILTHFHFDIPLVMIEQHPTKASTGTLVDTSSESTAALLPGKASFSQFLILTLEGRPLANREPLVMTASKVDQWPPIGSSFVTESPTDFFNLDRVDDPEAEPVADLAKCVNNIVQEITVPLQ